LTTCFIDRDYRVTPAEREGWATFLAMPASCMKAAREAFRRVHGGDTASAAFIAFISKTGLDDEALMERLAAALKGLEKEAAR
jgi:hypothetical protein